MKFELLDGYQQYYLMDVPLYDFQVEEIKRMSKPFDEAWERLQYNLDPENIPTWASPETGFEIWKMRNKKS